MPPSGAEPPGRAVKAPPARLYGRQHGHALRPRQARLIAETLPRLRLDPAAPLAGLAGFASVALEIGFGGGEHLIAAATANPESGFIGVEPYLNGMASAVSAIDIAGLGNIRLFDGDAAHLLDWLPASSLTAVDLLYPDPWPKKRHWKRRFVSAENLDRLARVLQPGGAFRFASDIPSYVEWTLFHTLRHPAFVWTATRADDWRRPFPDWPGTRYEAKALSQGRTPTYLSFTRT